VFRAATKDHLDDNERALGGDMNIMKSSTTDEGMLSVADISGTEMKEPLS